MSETSTKIMQGDRVRVRPDIDGATNEVLTVARFLDHGVFESTEHARRIHVANVELVAAAVRPCGHSRLFERQDSAGGTPYCTHCVVISGKADESISAIPKVLKFPPGVSSLDEAKTTSLYASLRSVLDRAYAQASVGKGRERHANGDAFEDQLIVQLGLHMRGSIVGNVFQACKKSIEAERLPRDQAVAELLGAINYLAGACIILEKGGEK